jgi:hypothetical protein
MIFDATVEGRTIRVEVRGRDGRYTLSLDGRSLDVDLHEAGDGFVSLLIEGRSYDVGLEPREGGFTVLLADDNLQVDLAGVARGAVASLRKQAWTCRLAAPMPGKVVRSRGAGQDVPRAGPGHEAMKMQNGSAPAPARKESSCARASPGGRALSLVE